jgi:ribosomal protein L16/L10AE
LFELSGVDEELAHSALDRAIQKLPMKARVVARPGLGSTPEVLV